MSRLPKCQSARGANGPRQLTGTNNGTGSQQLLLLLEQNEGEEVRDGKKQKKGRYDSLGRICTGCKYGHMCLKCFKCASEGTGACSATNVQVQSK